MPPNAPDAQKYDFTAIDEAIATYSAQGTRVGFRVTSFNSCCAASYPNGTNISVPAWLRTVPGATGDYVNSGVTHVVPDWNNGDYLSYTEALIAALGRRYNKDERVAVFELSGYGDFSENHVAFMRDQLGNPGPAPEDTIAQLGYYSQYADQYITKSSIIRLVNATLDAFRDTQIVAAPGNAEIVKQLFRDSPSLPNVVNPVGMRSDCIGVYGGIPTWATDQWSYYVQQNDPIVRERWKTAPIITEWCNWVPNTEQAYFEQALRDVVNHHVAMTSNTGFPYQHATTQMPSNLYALWARATKYSGYRYAMTSASVPNYVFSGSSLAVSVGWTNFGVTPAHEKWLLRYEVRNSSNTVVRTIDSPGSASDLYAEQNYTNINSDPASAAATDTLSISTSGLARGNYTLRAKLVWNDHKVGATHTFDYPPMQLAQQGRDASGTYPVGSFRIL